MSKAKPFLFGTALGASAMFFALQYHVVHSHDGFQVVPRTPQQSVGLAYADIRSWSPSQWTDRPELARALMAHGSSDLIAESVASTLADSVSEDSSTLDELRAFLNSSEAASATQEHPTEKSDSEKSEGGTNNDLFRIPFPQDARTGALADPFRVANADEEVMESDSGSKSRFTADDVLQGLKESPEAMEPRTIRQSSPVTTANAASTRSPTTTGKSVAQQSQEMEERIFGKSPTTASQAAPQTILKPAANAAESESMFEEVRTQLENRAQEALSRAQDSLSETPGAATKSSAQSSVGYVRDKAAEMLPESAKSLLNGAAPEIDKTAKTPLIDFDPFLE